MQGNTELVNYLVQKGVLQNPNLIESFKKIDRADFVLPQYYNIAYQDIPLPIGFGQTISQPTTVAFMLELLNPKKGEKVLDVGSGSGYTTALLSKTVEPLGKVYGVELIPSLVDFGNKNIQKYNLKNAKIIQANRHIVGLPKKAPFDKILVSASATRLPQELINQLKKGGIIVIPIQNSIYKIQKNHKGSINKEEFYGFTFVPLIKE